MANSMLTCATSQRRAAVRAANLTQSPRWNGIDFVEFEAAAGQTADTLRVYFLCPVPESLSKDQWKLYSPMLRRDVKVMHVHLHRSCPDSVILTTEPLCAGAAYVLTIHRTDIDPQFARVEFTADRDTVEIDPKPRPTVPSNLTTDPKINYVARDYASFRQLLLDRLAQTLPGWRERHVPDLGVTLVELFAYLGDYLAYYQDAVATEAYLGTARQRTSVKRHARLVDYQLHEGCNARTFVTVQVTGSDPVNLDPRGLFFVTEHPDPKKQDQAVLDPADLENLPANSYQPFEIVRWKPRCRNLECSDIKNIVGLMAALVHYNDDDSDRVWNNLQQSELVVRTAELVWNQFPPALKEQVVAYVSTADSQPTIELAQQIVEALNRITQQCHLVHRIIAERNDSNSNDWTSDLVYKRMSRFFDARSSDVEDNLKLLGEVFQGFFSRIDDRLIELHPGQNELRFYTWNQSECHLPIGSTRATLCDDPACLAFAPGSRLVPDATPYDDGDWILPSEASIPTGAAQTKPSARPKLSRYVLAHLDNTAPPDQTRRGWNLRHLSAGDLLVFEEKFGPKTHNAADADPRHRQVVRLTRVNFSVDPVSFVRVVEIEWDQEDALTFPLCISSIGPVVDGCKLKSDISVAHGNVLLIDHGYTVEPEWIGEPLTIPLPAKCGASYLDESPPPIPTRVELFRPALREQNLTFAASVTACASATTLLAQEAKDAIPALEVHSFPVATEPADAFRDDNVAPPTLINADDLDDPLRLLQRLARFDDEELNRIVSILPPHAARFLQDYQTSVELQQTVSALVNQNFARQAGTALQKANPDVSTSRSRQFQKEAAEFRAELLAAVTWNPKQHLLDSEASSQDVVVEIDNERVSRLRFGDGDLGKRPGDATSFYARYRVGNGTNGNVGADKIKHIVSRQTRPAGIVSVRNPLPSTGGTEPESLEHARVHAPSQYKKLRRAIIADDYAQIVLREFAGEVQQARASLNWMGTWYEVAVAVDPFSTVRDTAGLVNRVEKLLNDYRRIGHLLKVELPTYIGLNIDITVCVRSSYLSAHVRQELLDRFSPRVLDDGTKGFFHPDNFGFGAELYSSRIIAEAKKVSGVENVELTKFEKRGQGDQGEKESGVMTFGPLEIPRLENDPLRPEAGRFCLRMEGSR